MKHADNQAGLATRHILFTCLIGMALTLSACVPTIKHELAVTTPDKLGAAKLDASKSEEYAFSSWPSASWWLQYHDDELSRLIELALRDNPDIIEAAARVSKASAAANIANASIKPQVTGSGSLSRQRLSENSFYPPPFAGSQQTIADASVNASWDLDFWGKNRAALNAALSEVAAARAEREAARLLVSVSVARSYFQLARLLQQKSIADAEVAQRQHILQLIQMRVKTGLDTDAELYQGKTSLPEARAQLESINASLALSRNALAALLAQPVASLQALAPAMQTRGVQALPGYVPADLIGRRPDLAAARARIEAASHYEALAKAEFYPNISLTAFLGLSSFGLSKFSEMGSGVAGIGPALHLPIFDGRRLRSNLAAKSIDLDLAVNSYNQVLIKAIHDVADQIAELDSTQKQIQEQQRAISAAESAYNIAIIRYQNGLSNYLNVLAAEDTVLRVRRNVVELAARQLDLDIALIKSLGGGYQSDAKVQGEPGADAAAVPRAPAIAKDVALHSAPNP